MALRFHNTLAGAKELFEPLEPGHVRMYTCGPTVHDRIHIGNFRTFLFEDVLRRCLLYSGFRVTQVMNITDVEDKIIRKAKAAGVSIAEYTAAYTQRFFEDARTLGMESAEHYPRATAYIPEMVRLILRLRDRGHTYEREGSIYFRIASFPEYGKLSKVDLSGSIDGVRIDADEYEKDNPKDFVLWKAARPGEDCWQTELGPGRPGWHIECSAMAMALLGESFDIHTGGVDNIFPHHENEIAQSESATGKPFARYWLHAQHLVIGDRKMAKSFGNFVTLDELLERGYDPLAVRYLLLAAHYRTPLQFTEEALAHAVSAVERLRAFADRLRQAERPATAGGVGVSAPAGPAATKGATPAPEVGAGGPAKGPDDRAGAAGRNGAGPLGPRLERAEAGFREGLHDDLNVPRALGAVFDFVREVNTLLDRGLAEGAAAAALERLREWDRVLGVLGPEEREIPQEIAALVQEREEARSRRDFSRSDAIRQALLERGFAVEDTPGGPRVKSVPRC